MFFPPNHKYYVYIVLYIYIYIYIQANLDWTMGTVFGKLWKAHELDVIGDRPKMSDLLLDGECIRKSDLGKWPLLMILVWKFNHTQ